MVHVEFSKLVKSLIETSLKLYSLFMNSAPSVLYFIKQSCSFIKFYNNCFHLTGSVLFFSYSYILVFSTRIEPHQTVKILLPQDIVMSYSDLLTDSINFFWNELYCILHCSLSYIACAAGVSFNGASSGFVASPNFPNNFDPLCTCILP